MDADADVYLSHPSLAHQPLSRNQRLVPHIRVLVRHQLHHPRLPAKVVQRPANPYSQLQSPYVYTMDALLAPFVVLDVLPYIVCGDREDERFR